MLYRTFRGDHETRRCIITVSRNPSRIAPISMCCILRAPRNQKHIDLYENSVACLLGSAGRWGGSGHGLIFSATFQQDYLFIRWHFNFIEYQCDLHHDQQRHQIEHFVFCWPSGTEIKWRVGSLSSDTRDAGVASRCRKIDDGYCRNVVRKRRGKGSSILGVLIFAKRNRDISSQSRLLGEPFNAQNTASDELCDRYQAMNTANQQPGADAGVTLGLHAGRQHPGTAQGGR